MFLVQPKPKRHAHTKEYASVSSIPVATVLPPPVPSRVVSSTLLSPDIHDWKYVSEGGANLLFRLHPPDQHTLTPQEEALRGKIIHIRKCDIDKTLAASESEASSVSQPFLVPNTS